jgi:predicted alpha/beta hydrolase family esterase
MRKPNMKKNVLFIHGAGEGAYKEDALMAESLQVELGANYVVHCPKMANEENPEYLEWESQISSELASLDGKILLVGHSVGGSVLLKYVMEHKNQISIDGLILIATPYWGADDFWKWDEAQLPEDANRILADVPILLYHNRDDEVVPFNHLHLFAAKLPKATIFEAKGRGHQLENNLADVAAGIRSILQNEVPAE